MSKVQRNTGIALLIVMLGITCSFLCRHMGNPAPLMAANHATNSISSSSAMVVDGDTTNVWSVLPSTAPEPWSLVSKDAEPQFFRGELQIETSQGQVAYQVEKAAHTWLYTHGPMRILRQGSTLRVMGETEGQRAGRSLRAGLPEDWTLVQANYSATVVEGRLLHQRPAWVVLLQAHKPNRPSQRLWVDMKTGIRVRTEWYAFDGSLVARQTLVNLTVSRASTERGQALASEFQQAIVGHGPPPLMTVSEAEDALRFTLLLPQHVPDGYRLAGVRLPRQEDGVAHVIYTDGLGVISLFEQVVPWWVRRTTKPTPSATIEWQKRGRLMVLAGDAAPDELLAMASSL